MMTAGWLDRAGHSEDHRERGFGQLLLLLLLTRRGRYVRGIEEGALLLHPLPPHREGAAALACELGQTYPVQQLLLQRGPPTPLPLVRRGAGE